MEALDDMIFEYMYRDGTETTRPERVATFSLCFGESSKSPFASWFVIYHCIHLCNIGARVAILDQQNVFEYLSPSDLPRLWPEMYVPWQADAVRLALLAKYGGARAKSRRDLPLAAMCQMPLAIFSLSSCPHSSCGRYGYGHGCGYGYGYGYSYRCEYGFGYGCCCCCCCRPVDRCLNHLFPALWWVVLWAAFIERVPWRHCSTLASADPPVDPPWLSYMTWAVFLLSWGNEEVETIWNSWYDLQRTRHKE